MEIKKEIAEQISRFVETDKGALAAASGIHPVTLSRNLGGTELSMKSLESLMSALNLALRPQVFMVVWTARNMETLDTELVIEHYLLRKSDFEPLKRSELFTLWKIGEGLGEALLRRAGESDSRPFSGVNRRIVKLGKHYLCASLAPDRVFRRYIVE